MTARNGLATTIPTITVAFYRKIDATRIRPGDYLVGALIPVDGDTGRPDAAVIVDEVRMRPGEIDLFVYRDGWERRSKFVVRVDATLGEQADPTTATRLLSRLLDGGRANVEGWSVATCISGFHDADGNTIDATLRFDSPAALAAVPVEVAR